MRGTHGDVIDLAQDHLLVVRRGRNKEDIHVAWNRKRDGKMGA